MLEEILNETLNTIIVVCVYKINKFRERRFQIVSR